MTGVPEDFSHAHICFLTSSERYNTDTFTYEELNTFTDQYIGGLSFAIQPYTSYRDMNDFRNYFKVTAKFWNIMRTGSLSFLKPWH